MTMSTAQTSLTSNIYKSIRETGTPRSHGFGNVFNSAKITGCIAKVNKYTEYSIPSLNGRCLKILHFEENKVKSYLNSSGLSWMDAEVEKL